MISSSATKRTLGIVGVLVLLYAAVIVGAAALVAANTDHNDRPYLQIAVGDQLHRVEPIYWCDVLMRECDPPMKSVVTRSKSRIPVTVGETALVSVSQQIATGPWRLVAEYYTPTGIVRDEPFFLSDSTYTVALHSTVERTLLTIEVQAPSAIETSDGVVARGILAADTAPAK